MSGGRISGMTREAYVLTGADVFTRVMQNEILGPDGIKDLEEFLKGIEERSRKASREYTEFLNRTHEKSQAYQKEAALTSHANHARSIASHIAKMKGSVEAAKIDYDNPRLRLECLAMMGYLRCQCEAMENYIL